MLNSLFNVLQDLWAIIFSLLASLVLGFIFSLTFVKIKKNDGIKYIQVALSVRDENTLNRELNSLKNINDNYPKYIITLDEEEVDHEGIKQINAIDFLTGRVDL